MKVSEAIRKLRFELRLSQAELSALLGCGQTAVSAYEQGDRHPRPHILQKMADLAKENKLEFNIF